MKPLDDYAIQTYPMSADLLGGSGGRTFFEFSAADAPACSVPEPASWTLFGVGCALLAWRRRARGAPAR